MHRQTGANADLIDTRPGGADAGNVNNVASVADRQMAAALADIAKLLDHRLAYLRHIQRGDVLKAETQHVHAQREGVGARVALQKAHKLQRLYHAVGGRLRHIHQPVQLGKGQFAMLLAKGQQQL